MEDKIKRFIELSKEFTVDGKEIYKDLTNTHYGGVTNTNSCFIGSSTISYSSSPTSVNKTQLETFEENVFKMVEKARRYEEYLILQTDLLNYYKALTKLK